MICRVLLVMSLWRAASALSPLMKEIQRQAVGGIGMAVMTALPLSAHAVQVVRIDADIPSLIQIAKVNKDVVLKLAQQSASAVSITKWPTNLFEFARDAAAGDVFVEINGSPIDLSLLSELGGIDVGISTEQGDISVTLTSKLLPKLPFLSKRVVPLSSVDPTATSATATVTKAAAAVLAESAPKKALLDRPFFLDPLHKGWTNLQVIGSTTLGLGAAYGGAYAYYIKSADEEERASQLKKEAAAAKRKEATKKEPEAAEEKKEAAAAKKKETAKKEPVAKKVAKKPVEEVADNSEETREAVAKKMLAKRVGVGKSVAEASFPAYKTLVETKKSEWKFWKK